MVFLEEEEVVVLFVVVVEDPWALVDTKSPKVAPPACGADRGGRPSARWRLLVTWAWTCRARRTEALVLRGVTGTKEEEEMDFPAADTEETGAPFLGWAPEPATTVLGATVEGATPDVAEVEAPAVVLGGLCLTGC